MRPAPDYADPASWIEFAPNTGDANLFYVHPTTFTGESWNQPWLRSQIEDEAVSVTRRQAFAFASVADVCAPRYRQAGSRAFLEPGAAAAAAYDLAYQDVLTAFRTFLKQKRSRKLILCGHSQGALHVARLIREVIEPEGLLAELVAAYAIGIGISEGLFGKHFRAIAPGTSPHAPGCLISWNCFLETGDPQFFLARTRARDEFALGGRAAGAPVCLNPISFDRHRPVMHAMENPGSLTADGAIVSGAAGAHCAEGVVRVSPAPLLAMAALPGGNLHLHDIDLFYLSLRQDAERRCAALGSVA